MGAVVFSGRTNGQGEGVNGKESGKGGKGGRAGEEVIGGTIRKRSEGKI